MVSAAKSTGPANPTKPVKAVEPARNVPPTKVAAVAKPAGPVKPVVPAPAAAPVRVVEPVKAPEPAKTVKVVPPAKVVAATKPAEPVKPVVPAPAAAPVKVVESAKAAKAVAAAKPTGPVKTAPPGVVSEPGSAPEAPGELKTKVAVSPIVGHPHPRRKTIEVPAILTETDAPATPALTGPGEKYSLGPTPAATSDEAPEGELPEAYGTKKLFLTARDPHWLYAHWDLTVQQQHDFNAESSDGHLVLRIYAAKFEGHPLYEIHVHPESRHWFVHVERAGNSYCAELGCYSPVGKWTRIAISSATVTPPDAASPETDVEFATIPFEFPFHKLMQVIEEAVQDNLPLAQAVEELRRTGHPELPRFKPSPVAHGSAFSRSGKEGHSPAPAPVFPPINWTPQQEQALAKVISIDQSRRIWMGSLEITELIRRRVTLGVSQEVNQEVSQVSSPFRAFGGPEVPGGPGAAGLPTVSSPAVPFGAGPPAEKGFWFNVNAELIIYGATEPGAKVTLGGQAIKLRPDGTFSYRFALPDGEYDLPVAAVSADGADGRAADLKFSRETAFQGEVGAHPQNSSLTPPQCDNLPANL
jgi:hypothetical protein